MSIALIPFALVLFAYLYLHIFIYGLAKGDSYIWDFSPRAFNTIFWYMLWSFNLPEMLVDYIGPGFRLNPNLLRYYSPFILTIITLLVIKAAILIITLCCYWKQILVQYKIIIFSLAWFLIALSPVMFLPLHKFSYELTVPVFGTLLIIALIITKAKAATILFISVFGMASIATQMLTYNTHWITKGGKTAYKVFQYFEQDKLPQNSIKKVIFYDAEEDKKLLWLPSQQLKQILSDNNFFKVFYSGRFYAYYGQLEEEGGYDIKIRAKIFFE